MNYTISGINYNFQIIIEKAFSPSEDLEMFWFYINAAKGKELLIKNYSCSLPKDKQKKFEQLALEDIQSYASNKRAEY
ncbi:hypothetical protein PI95_003540 [Hassallia byssoidea VB512170]|uniref:Uncharacterized protein n=1 Tax=Hassallia byssoidea VB512170 TaxID=1304833 RepID=A0A846H524_9CYAN|nr:hypothetical protein [Hassalia byssoidea]NEU71681.1 hypothetical protein [Hassalia byssoidea VB512170]